MLYIECGGGKLRVACPDLDIDGLSLVATNGAITTTGPSLAPTASHASPITSLNGSGLSPTMRVTRKAPLRDALKLAELQPHTLLHPDKRTGITSILGLQGEEKAGRRGMCTVVNPSYSVFIANLKPDMCPLGAFAFYLHYLYDEKNIIGSMNPHSSWSQFSDNAFQRAEPLQSSRLKAHLARHLLGYKQEALGVDAAETSKLDWVRGETYLDTYAPSLPKKAILAAAGYQADEQYDPLWCPVRITEQFLARICPMAKEIYVQVAGKPNLVGTTNHWLMIMDLHPYFFQCGAAIWQKCPKSAIFRLPGFIGKDSIEFKKMGALLEHRTSALSPNQGFSASRYHRNVLLASPDRGHNIPDSPISIHVSADLEETGTYEFEDGSIRAFVNESPKLPQTPRSVAQVDLVLPPVAAFYKKGAITGFIPPVLGQKSARWLDIFPLIHQPKLCWDVWGPDKSLEQFSGLDELWTTYVIGAPVLDTNGTQTGMKPPLKLVKQHFQHKWQTSSEKKERTKRGKIWQRFCEIPEWIDRNTTARHVSVDTVMQELEAIRSEGSGESVEPKGLNWLGNELAQRRKDQLQRQHPTSDPSGSLVSADSIVESMSAPESVSAPAAALGPAFSLDQVVGPAAETRSLLNLATVEGFASDNRGLRSLVMGVDISICIDACVAALQNSIGIHAGDDNAVLKILFYQLCSFLQAPVIFVFVFDSPGRPSIKRGKKVINCPPSVIEPLKGMIKSFGYYFCDAPGEAEAELAQLNELGFIDVIITEDSDVLVFGATCIIRTLGFDFVARLYSVENTDSGDYNSGIDGCGPMVVHALALHGLGDKLLDALTSSSGAALDKRRDALRTELQTNSSGLLGKRHPKLAESIPSTFPDLEIAQSYLDPLTSWSSRFVGVAPDPSLWVPREPSIHRISTFCLNRFQWNNNLLKKLESNLWPGVAFKMISLPYVIYKEQTRSFASPFTNGRFVKHIRSYKDSGSPKRLTMLRIRMTVGNFVKLAQPDSTPRDDDSVILSVSESPYMGTGSSSTGNVDGNNGSDTDSIEIIESSTTKGNKLEDAGDIIDVDEVELLKAHCALAAGGVVDLTAEL
ncbi:hypothetical protein B0H10DRAFT_1957785 [Mycena sp. CBHHK59/15]|nr:hypothetical protein B0H10DRAFT_1957785 [Mycena sp. CBHHK59/15]